MGTLPRENRGAQLPLPASLRENSPMWTIRTLAVVLLVAALPAAADEPKKADGEKHWSYLHGITPPKWGEVSPTCATGTHQSPVALSTKQAKAPPASSRSAALHSRPKTKGAYTIQIASAHRRADAERVAKRVAARRPRIVTADVPGKGRWYRVQIGAYDSRESARLALASMSGVHGIVTPAR